MTRHGAIRWRLMSSIVKLIQKNNGIIFGGYVRDRLIHDHYACEYYENFYKCDNVIGGDSYSNLDVHPESSLRTLLPNDIDCYMTSQTLPAFISDLKDNMLCVTAQGMKESDAAETIVAGATAAKLYFPDAQLPENLKHTKLIVTFAVHPLLKTTLVPRQYEVKIDVIHSEQALAPPFGKIDFECNSIILTPDNEFKLCHIYSKLDPREKIIKLNSIIKDILHQRTRILYEKVATYRIESLLEKNWTISSSNISVCNVNKNHKDDVCFLCLDEVMAEGKADGEKLVYSFRCCNSVMHKKCMCEFIEKDRTSKCPMCRDMKFMQDDDKKIIEL